MGGVGAIGQAPHAPEDYDERVRQVISGSADFSLTLGPDRDSEDDESPSGEGL